MIQFFQETLLLVVLGMLFLTLGSLESTICREEARLEGLHS